MRAILLNAPWWVWPVLLMIVALGLRATRRRLLNPLLLVLLPASFAVVSLGLLLGRNASHADILATWGGGFAAGFGLGWLNAFRAKVYPEGRGVSVPGSWSILFVPLAFFLLQFWLGYLRVAEPGALDLMPYRVLAPFGGAAMTGFFAGRATALFRLYRHVKGSAALPAAGSRASPE